MATLAKGQKWGYKGSGTSSSYLVIQKIDKKAGEEIVHLTIKNVKVGEESWDITHIPIEKGILMKSLTSQRKGNAKEDDKKEFEEAYQLWKAQNGGAWSITLDEVIQSTVSTMR